MIEVAAALLSAVVGALAAVFASIVKVRLAKRRLEDGDLKYEIKGRAINVPVAKDLTSLERRVSSLMDISPRLAVLDGWGLVTRAILQRARLSRDSKFDASQNVLQIARDIPEISEETIERLSRLRVARNLVAHGAENVEDVRLRQAAELIVPILSEIGIPLEEASTKRDQP
ncbi:hypothetical protein [Ramlibacter tataouinensis]|uniref:DUF4145 domain-containing protein n=1 Tax=Ramlibacter tataouinensis (strain ATCC BAA-407 / DSM 14655 / LMG 21543 / TTB310) TaxID=365046 RepID=F5Y4P0_RAMTT|nr:hypothetical protein [Ramlibacter tataouinensis]AEG91358.1 Hypothetical protein Rta_02914 [Ramlibacter tataouinensis TTB310]